LPSALVGAGKRLLTGESLFMTIFVNTSREKKAVAFAAVSREDRADDAR
jgi:uncharacterized protein (AIM24 family)